ncbi:NAD-dependent protein deacetylase hst2-1 [Lasiodiplodia hormozganensis]|uniref:NAD-dependent protein deacetylase hst2-1 n=1 Tax=Lasiodiplodia hormozganensis TaxID=869390 RepID=A0AA39XU03_9PEZI|nr:NAD-dependent protein deacetylase hst2-1 [Lasiodiplodia hormozganensis]
MENLGSQSAGVPIQELPSRLVILRNLPLLLASVAVLLLVKLAATAVYNVYFHPLSKYPGPKYATMSTITWWLIGYTGRIEGWTRRQHEKYGEVVRLGPDRLSYTNPQALKDIYGHRSGGRQENGKDKRFYSRDINNECHVLNTEDVKEHGALRRIFSNAFSDRALKLQEPLIKRYVDQLVDLMRRTTKENGDAKLDMVKLYNCTTFDIMGDLTFGEPLGLLEQSEYTPWVRAVFGSIKAQHLARIMMEYPVLGKLAVLFTPKGLDEQVRVHFQHSADRVDRRLAKSDDGKPDIWGLVLDKGKDLISLGQMHANSSLFMIAGTETTATLLSGLTWYLLKNPDKLKKAVEEVRSRSEEDLSLEELPRLPYLNACFEEGLRVYPPVPIGLPRETPEGGNMICGEWVPGKTRVSLHNWSAYRSEKNFKDPDSFVPERWLPNTGYDSDRKEVLQPFSFGPRNCLGKNLAYHEMRIIMAKVLWHFDLELCSESANWADQEAYSLWQKPELWCRAKPIRRKHKPHRQQAPKGKQAKDKNPNRGKPGRGWKMGQDESSIVDESIAPSTLDSRSLDGIAKYIREGRAKRVVFMVGAGISTSAGIPDFRSPDTGLYANLARLDLPYAEAVFDISYFNKNPMPFYTLAHELYPGKYRPTITHAFMRLLYDKGILLKVFTQNIDCLEREAGLPGEAIVEAHGSFAEQACIECGAPFPDDEMKEFIRCMEPPHCKQEFCEGLVKPKIVFFGEPLPAAFFENRELPAAADLAIIMGTSLTVQPFASLPNFVSHGCPRLLINKEQVGSIGSRGDDVMLLEDCDAGVRKLAEACGWLEELEALWAKFAPKAAADLGKEPPKTKEEAVEEEVARLSQEVDQTLKLAENQHKWLENHIETKAQTHGSPQPEKTLAADPDMGNVTDNGESKAEVPGDIKPDATPKVSVHERNGSLAHVFPHISNKPSL